MGILDGKTVIVAGGGRGIGRECALQAAREGAAVVVADLGRSVHGSGAAQDDPAQSVAEEIRASGGVAIWSATDITDYDAVGRLVARALAEFGGLHAVLNPAGILREGRFRDMTRDDWAVVMDTHLTGAFNLCRASINHFVAQKDGAYVLFTSTSGLIGHATHANYAAAKLGVVGLSRIIAMEEHANNVRSNVLAPFAWTRMMETARVDRKGGEERLNLLRRKVRADQVAQLAVALCAPAANEFSGEIFGARGNEIFLFSQPRPVRSLARSNGWTPETVIRDGLPALRSHRTGLGGSVDYFTWDPL